MDRRNFLAFIPALSAIPLVGQKAEQDKDKIIIYPEGSMPNPSLMKEVQKAALSPNGFYVHLYHQGQIYATGWASELEFRHGWNANQGIIPDVDIKAKLFRLEGSPQLTFEKDGRVHVLYTEPGDTAHIKYNVDIR